MQKTGMTGSTIAGMNQYFNFQNASANAVQYGDTTYIVNAPAAVTTLVGKMLRVEDSTSLANTVRGLEVQVNRGTNTAGENTAISGFGRTFGVRGTTDGDAGSVFEPAGIYGETRGTTQGNAIRGLSSTITTASLASLYQGTSTFAGIGLEMNFGNNGGSFSSTTSRFLDLKKAGTSQFVVMHDGRTGIGSSTPTGLLSINPNSIGTAPAFVIGSSTATNFIVTNNGNVGIGALASAAPNKLTVYDSTDGQYAVNIQNRSTTGFGAYVFVNHNLDYVDALAVQGWNGSGATNILNVKANGNIGIGSSSPSAKLSIHTNAGTAGTAPLFTIGSSTAAGTGTSTLLSLFGNGQFALGTTSPDNDSDVRLEAWGTPTGNSRINVVAQNGGYAGLNLFRPGNTYYDWGIENQGGILYFRHSENDWDSYSTNMVIQATGDVGIGTTSPWATLSVVTGTSSSNEKYPAFVFATTSNWLLNGQRPILWGFATTTGDLNRERVAIGTTSVWGSNGGIRDSLTVDGRIYSTWMNVNCYAGSSMAANVTADTAGVCGDFMLDINTDGGLSAVTGLYPPRVRVRAGINSTFAASEAAYLRTNTLMGPATSSPVMEARVGIPPSSRSATTTRAFIVGFTDITYASTTYSVLPTNGVFFTASSTNNWSMNIRRGGVSTFIGDTGVATTSDMNRFRIEVSSSSAIFLLNGTIVGNVTPPGGMPGVPMAPMVGIHRIGATVGSININDIDVSYIQAWIDDPASSAPATETIAEANVEQTPFDTSLNLVQNGDIAEFYQVGTTTEYVPGMLVSARGERFGYVSHTANAYDDSLMGAISTSPQSTLGLSDSGLVQVSIAGRAPVIVSLENGPIAQGDAIVASAIPGVGMRSTMPGVAIGRALESVGTGSCNNDLEEELEEAGIELPANACVVRILTTIEQGFSIGSAPLFAEASTSTASFVTMATELASTAFEQGAMFTKFVVGQITAKVAYIGTLFTEEVHTKKLCIADADGNETCITKDQLDALLISSGGTPVPPEETGDGSTGGSTGGTSADTEAPVIALIGGTTVNIAVGEAYVDQGVVVSDNVDTSSTYTMSLNGSPLVDPSMFTFDTSIAGTYTVWYSATDAAGNTGTVSRTVVVEAAADPVPSPEPAPEPPPEPIPEPEPAPEPTPEPPPADPAPEPAPGG
jgi:hypothetical protein